MAKRIVVWTETAVRQRRKILKYWVERNGTPTYAEKLIKVTTEQIKVILSNPKLFKKADFLDTHVSALGHFSIFYKFTKDSLIITAFWDNRQDLKNFWTLSEKQTAHNIERSASLQRHFLSKSNLSLALGRFFSFAFALFIFKFTLDYGSFSTRHCSVNRPASPASVTEVAYLSKDLHNPSV